MTMVPINVKQLIYITEDSEKDEKDKDKNGKTMPAEKLKQKESISRYGSFYLRLGAIGKVTLIRRLYASQHSDSRCN